MYKLGQLAVRGSSLCCCRQESYVASKLARLQATRGVLGVTQEGSDE